MKSAIVINLDELGSSDYDYSIKTLQPRCLTSIFLLNCN